MEFPDQYGSNHITLGPDDIRNYIPRDITHVTLTSETEEIPESAFFLCESLVAIDIVPKGKLCVIGGKAFYNCIVLSFVPDLPPTVNRIDNHAFCWCGSLMQISLAATKLESISEYTFAYCLSLKQVLLPPTIKVIDTCAFLDCKQLLNIEFPEGMEVIMDHAFKMCHSLPILHVPTTVSKIGYRAFANCSELHTVEISLNGQLQEIDNGAFRGCYKLDNIAIPVDTVVHDDTFRLCPNLAENLSGDLPPDYDKAIVHFLKHRFDDQPLHQLCYMAPYTMNMKHEIEVLLKHSNHASWYKQFDPLRKSPCHLLTMASSFNHESQLHSECITMIFERSIRSLGLDSWRNSMRELISHFAKPSTLQERMHQIRLIISKLEEYELLEATSLLELSLWKSKMKQFLNESSAAGTTGDDAMSLVDPSLRSQCLVQCGSRTIINSVYSFLRRSRAPMTPFFGESETDNSSVFSNETATSW